MDTNITRQAVIGFAARFTRPVSRLIVVPAALALVALSHSADATLVTFDEAQLGAVAGFNGQANPYLLSTDGLFRVESFWLNNSSHFHISSFSGNMLEQNHNNSSGALNSLQGLRITRVDNGLFDFDSMDILAGQAAISSSINFTTGVGSWSLFTAGTQNFGTTYDGVSAVYIADPGAAGGNTSDNRWDNLTMNATAVPEPTTALFGLALVGSCLASRRRRMQAAV